MYNLHTQCITVEKKKTQQATCTCTSHQQNVGIFTKCQAHQHEIAHITICVEMCLAHMYMF